MSIADGRASALAARRVSFDKMVDALLGAAALSLGEWLWVSLAAHAEFAGTWEFIDALTGIVPLAWIVVGAGALLGAGALSLAQTAGARARIGVGILAAVVAVAMGIGVTRGRHFTALPLRASFVGALAAASFATAYAASPWIARVTLRAPRAVTLLAAAAALSLGICNHAVLPRLYPAFHLGLALVTAMTAPLIGRGLRGDTSERAGDPAWLGWLAPLVVISAFLAAVGTAPRMSRAISRVDNLRVIFLDHAPLLGLGVELGAKLAPPPPFEPSSAEDAHRNDGRLQIDWRGHDILLITVDALRADHVGAYGYARPTTPEIDKLAAEGALFSHAYCPTPHTSYSVASLMTGKNLHPLLSQGLGADSDTLAGLTRLYGYRTAAFYPPAVFFIDEALFTSFRDKKLDFEYARIEFADPNERAKAVTDYLATQSRDQRLFVWVHLFEPHEPYVAHAAHVFGDRDVDRYDGEVAFADAGIGAIVRSFRAKRPSAVVIVTADHGEEFGEHRGRYHGTTVYEEQVRVPLVVSGAGIGAGGRIDTPVQTIDLLPTVLGALDIPRPPRVQGYDLGHWLRRASGEGAVSRDGGAAPTNDAPLASSSANGIAPPAVSETDDHILLADAMWRLVCARRAGACALYDLAADPAESRDVAAANAERFQNMKAALRRIEATQGHFEGASATDAGRPWPAPIRRGLAGDSDAAGEIAELLEDSDVRFRQKAAEVLFELKRSETVAPLKLALARDDDVVVRRFAALALARLGQSNGLALELLNGSDRAMKRYAALALGENGDVRAGPVLVEWWSTERLPYPRAREVLAAFDVIRPKEAVPSLIASLEDLRLRPHVAATLAAIGAPAARAPLLERFAAERHKDTRRALGAALVKLGARSELAAPLIRFLGTPDPLPDGVEMARLSGVLPLVGTSEDDLARLRAAQGPVSVPFKISASGAGEASASGPGGYRVLVRAASTDGKAAHITFARCAQAPALDAKDGAAHATSNAAQETREGATRVTLDFTENSPRELVLKLPDALAPAENARNAPVALGTAAGNTGNTRNAPSHCLAVERTTNLAIEGIAIVPLAEDLPPPPPEPWEAVRSSEPLPAEESSSAAPPAH